MKNLKTLVDENKCDNISLFRKRRTQNSKSQVTKARTEYFKCKECLSTFSRKLVPKRGSVAPAPKYCDKCKRIVVNKKRNERSKRARASTALRLAFGCAAVLVLCVTGCGARFAEVRGSVWHNHTPVSGAVVELQELSFYRVQATRTDKDGEFVIDHIIPGHLRRATLTVSVCDSVVSRQYVGLPSFKVIEI